MQKKIKISIMKIMQIGMYHIT